MTPNERYQKTEDILSKFNNGKYLFNTSALFNKTVQMMVNGASEYDVIEALLKVTEETQQAFEQHLIRGK